MTLGDLISTLYEEFLVLYGDEEVAYIMTTTIINDLLAATRPQS